MLAGKVIAALRLLSNPGSAGVLPTSKQIIDLLKEKHPEGTINTTTFYYTVRENYMKNMHIKK